MLDQHILTNYNTKDVVIIVKNMKNLNTIIVSSSTLFIAIEHCGTDNFHNSRRSIQQ